MLNTKAEGKPSSGPAPRQGEALVGLAPPKQSTKPPQIEIWNTINQWSIHQFFNIKPPYRRLSSDGSDLDAGFRKIESLSFKDFSYVRIIRLCYSFFTFRCERASPIGRTKQSEERWFSVVTLTCCMMQLLQPEQLQSGFLEFNSLQSFTPGSSWSHVMLGVWENALCPPYFSPA